MPTDDVPEMFLDLAFPGKGVDHSHGFSFQTPGTTPDAQNVRTYDPATDRDRGARRPGLTKYVESQIFAGPIQCIENVVVALDQTAGTGDTFGQGATSTTTRVYAFSNGATNMTSSAVANANNLGCVDSEGNFYVAAAAASTIQITKYGTDYTQKWQTTLTLAGSGSPQVFGLSAFDGYLYLFAVGATNGSITSPGIYRFLTSTGTNPDSNAPWLTASGHGLATVTGTQSKCFQCICAGGGYLAVCGKVGTALALQQIVIATQIVAFETTLQSTLESHPAKVITDAGNNFYVLTNATGAAGVNKIFKVTHSGVIPSGWPVVSVGNNGTDIAYSSEDFLIGIVGNALYGTTDSFQTYNADTGVFVAGGQQNSIATWHAIAGDDRGKWRLRRSIASGNADLVSTDYPAAVANWSLTTNLGVITPTLWLACSGAQVAPADTTMQSTRIMRTLVVVNGGLYRIDNGVSNITETFCSAAAPVVWSTINGLVVYFVDGSTEYPTYNASTNVAGNLEAVAPGELPADANGRGCRLNCTWRGRLVMAGLISDPHNWFMSAIDDPTNWDYGPFPVVPTQAIAGTTAPAGLCPDIITCLIPYSDDLLIFGCDHSIYMMVGDPMAGGRIDTISDITGMAWGRPFCKGPDGTVYFFSSRGAVYAMVPGAQNGGPQNISQQISRDLATVNTGTNLIRMVWDDRAQGFHLFISPFDVSTTTTHYFWEARTQAWWPVVFSNTSHNPLTVFTLDGDDPSDRVVLLGGRDGYIRYFDSASLNDDGTTITSYVVLGPFLTQNLGEVMFEECQSLMSLASATVTYSVMVGQCAEEALAATAVATGTWSAGRNNNNIIKRAGYAAYLKISATTNWAIEAVRVLVSEMGKVRRRGT